MSWLWGIASTLLILAWAAALPLGLFAWVAALLKKFPLAQRAIRPAMWGLLCGALSVVGSCVESFAEVAHGHPALRSELTSKLISLGLYKTFLLLIPAVIALTARRFIKKRLKPGSEQAPQKA